jgi:glucose dehydrogenase
MARTLSSFYRRLGTVLYCILFLLALTSCALLTIGGFAWSIWRISYDIQHRYPYQLYTPIKFFIVTAFWLVFPFIPFIWRKPFAATDTPDPYEVDEAHSGP